MSDPHSFQSRSNANRDLGERLRAVRVELYGQHGTPELARDLHLSPRTWSRYEDGVTIPGEVLLAVLDLTRAETRWLLRGVGEMFRPNPGMEVVSHTRRSC